MRVLSINYLLYPHNTIITNEKHFKMLSVCVRKIVYYYGNKEEKNNAELDCSILL